jgi:ABC-type branched-subunit amino acid transport system permease subunit
MRKLGALGAYLLVAAICGFAGFRLGISVMHQTPYLGVGGQVAGLIIAGGVMAILTGLMVSAPETRPFRLVFLGLCTLCIGLTVAGFTSISAV